MGHHFTDVMTIEIRIAEPCSKDDKRIAIVTKLIELTDVIERRKQPLRGGTINNDAGYLSYTVMPAFVCSQHGPVVMVDVCPECAKEHPELCEPITA